MSIPVYKLVCTVSMHLCVQICFSTQLRTCINMHACIHLHSFAHTHTHARTHTHTCLNAQVHHTLQKHKCLYVLFGFLQKTNGGEFCCEERIGNSEACKTRPGRKVEVSLGLSYLAYGYNTQTFICESYQ